MTAVLFVILSCTAFSFSIDGSFFPPIAGITINLPSDTYLSGGYSALVGALLIVLINDEFFFLDFGISKNVSEKNDSNSYFNGKAGFLYIRNHSTTICYIEPKSESHRYSNSFGFILKGSLNFKIIGNFGIGAFCNFYFPIFMTHQNNNTFTNEFKLGFLPSLGLSINLF